MSSGSGIGTMPLGRSSLGPRVAVELAGLIFVVAGLVAVPIRGHSDPAGSTGTGVNIQITAFRADGVTPVLSSDTGFGRGVVSECERILFQATLSWAGGGNAAFEGGTWTLTTPDDEVHGLANAGENRLVHDLGEVPCIGGISDDFLLPGGRGLCNNSLEWIAANQVSYTVSLADASSGALTAQTEVTDAVAHIGTSDISGVGAITSLTLRVARSGDRSLSGTDSCQAR